MIKVKVLGGGDYKRLFEEEDGFEVDNDQFDLVCFTGGTDINPNIYNHKRHPLTSPSDTYRDENEVYLFDFCTYHGIPMVGICRGAQLLCALSGGSLYQHVENHGRSHSIQTDIGEMVVTSSHHQMMNISSVENVKVLGYTDPLSYTYETGDGPQEAPERDIEVAYFPSTRALAHQPHPEWMNINSPYRRFFFKTIYDHLFNRGGS